MFSKAEASSLGDPSHRQRKSLGNQAFLLICHNDYPDMPFGLSPVERRGFSSMKPSSAMEIIDRNPQYKYIGVTRINTGTKGTKDKEENRPGDDIYK
ncbi:hypothetical protein EYB31_06870 [Paenibacillus thalictri]|uniref:Uncharacterized protein n=1 Tax=Paenibacillus thalictri TaxID=2527873 RepID=A0A4V2J4K0_9BACL|nr:hypothetical protein EYB31_06870 [Paenibacillus thalictri]